MSNKEFVKNHVPFKALKKAGFFDKSIRATDYDKICDRFLSYFGTTKTAWAAETPRFHLQVHPNVVTGKMPDTINENGDLVKGSGFKLSL